MDVLFSRPEFAFSPGTQPGARHGSLALLPASYTVIPAPVYVCTYEVHVSKRNGVLATHE